MPPRRTKFVTLKISSDELVKFPELTAHVQVKPPRQQRPKQSTTSTTGTADAVATGGTPHKVTKLKIKGNSISIIESAASASRETSLKPSASTDNLSNTASSYVPIAIANPTNTSSAIISASASSKLSSNVRVGVSGLTMNTSIVRELETTGHVGQWTKFNNNENGETTTTYSGKFPDVNDLDTKRGVISMKDYRGFKGLEIKDKQNELIQHAQSKGRKIVRSFSGYLMLWPSWHKVKEGTLKKKRDGDDDIEERSGSIMKKQNSKDVQTPSETPSETPKPDIKAEIVVPTIPEMPAIMTLSDIIEARNNM